MRCPARGVLKKETGASHAIICTSLTVITLVAHRRWAGLSSAEWFLDKAHFEISSDDYSFVHVEEVLSKRQLCIPCPTA